MRHMIALQRRISLLALTPNLRVFLLWFRMTSEVLFAVQMTRASVGSGDLSNRAKQAMMLSIDGTRVFSKPPAG